MAIPDYPEEGDRNEDCDLGRVNQHTNYFGQNLSLRLIDDRTAESRTDVSVNDSSEIEKESIMLQITVLILLLAEFLLTLMIKHIHGWSTCCRSMQTTFFSPLADANADGCSPADLTKNTLQTEDSAGPGFLVSPCLSLPVNKINHHVPSSLQELQADATAKPQQNPSACYQLPMKMSGQQIRSKKPTEHNLSRPPETSSEVALSSSASGISVHSSTRRIQTPPSMKPAGTSVLSNQNDPVTNNGLFYSGTRGRETCLFCHGKVRICDNIDPLEDHARRFPACSFIRRRYGDSSASDLPKTKV